MLHSVVFDDVDHKYVKPFNCSIHLLTCCRVRKWLGHWVYFVVVESAVHVSWYVLCECRLCRMSYGGQFGGVVTFRPEMFRRINGFPPVFFGWGGEDDNMGARYRICKARVLNLSTFDSLIDACIFYVYSKISHKNFTRSDIYYLLLFAAPVASFHIDIECSVYCICISALFSKNSFLLLQWNLNTCEV